jgi:hypothetical protein
LEVKEGVVVVDGMCGVAWFKKMPFLTVTHETEIAQIECQFLKASLCC